MKQDMRNSGNGTNRLFSRLAAEKKKTVTALCLIALMVFMWARVLATKTPETAEAAPRQEEVDPDISGSNLELKISFIELPKVPGRNDELKRDFFDAEGWLEFIDRGGGNKDVRVVSRDGDEGIVRRVAEMLKLEAIGMGKYQQAFINDELLDVGDKLSVRDGVDTYECEVVGIEDETVVIRWGEAEITLKLTQAIEVSN